MHITTATLGAVTALPVVEALLASRVAAVDDVGDRGASEMLLQSVKSEKR
jgi:hypothetical protein